MPGVKDQKFTVLRNLKTVITRAGFWKVPHNTKDDEIHLKVGRYKKPKTYFDKEVPEEEQCKSELTLDGEEFGNLVKFIQENYEPFRHGAKAFIPLDNPYDDSVAQQIKGLLGDNNNSRMLEFLTTNDVIPEDLEIGLVHARRARAVDEFDAMLESDLREPNWQSWFEKNTWVLGSDFVRVLDERAIDTKNISDFLMESYDGFLDIVEIKRPEGNLQFWQASLDHGNYVPHSDLVKAIIQASKYIHEVEKEADSIKFFERVGQVNRLLKKTSIFPLVPLGNGI